MVDGYGVKGKFTSNTGASAAKKNKEKKYKDASFRADEEKSLTKSIGTAGPKMRADGTRKDDGGPTAKQKEEFRKQEETYLTKSPGTVGDKYYKNPEGTGTGQGGSGIPIDSKASTTKAVETFEPQQTIFIELPFLDNDNDQVFSMQNFVDKTPDSSSYLTDINRTLYNSDSGKNRLDVSQTSFFNLAEDLGTSDQTRVSFSLKPRTSGSLFRGNIGLTGADASVNIALPRKGRSLFGGDT